MEAYYLGSILGPQILDTERYFDRDEYRCLHEHAAPTTELHV